MDHSTGTLLTPAVAMSLVESDAATLTASLADGAVRDLSHDESPWSPSAAAPRPASKPPCWPPLARSTSDGQLRPGRCSCRPAGGCRAVAHQRNPGDGAARTVRTARTLRAGVLPNTTAALAAGAISVHAAGDRRRRQKKKKKKKRDWRPPVPSRLIEPEAVALRLRRLTRPGDGEPDGGPSEQALDPDTAEEKRAATLRTGVGLTLSPLLDGGFAVSPAPPTRPPAGTSSPPSTPPPRLTTGDRRDCGPPPPRRTSPTRPALAGHRHPRRATPSDPARPTHQSLPRPDSSSPSTPLA